MNIYDDQIQPPHRYPMDYRPIITDHDQLAIHAELTERFRSAWLRHHAERGAVTDGLAVETTDIGAMALTVVRLYDLIVPMRHHAGAVAWHIHTRPLDPDHPDGAWLYYWPDITPAPCPGLPIRPTVGPHSTALDPDLDPDGDTIDLADLLGGTQQVVTTS